jgi:tetratricopeptide (TPR) repeat protein
MVSMNKRGFFALTLILLAAFVNRAAAVDVSQDTYGDLSDFLEGIYGIDNNAGLTAFPALNVPLGGRSEGMAGAFSAVADDISFLEWNPAGSSMLAKTEIAFFHNNWIADTKIEGAAFASRYKNLGFAAGGKWLYTPFTEYNIYGERASKGYYSEAVGILNASYNFLSGYYFSGISLGVNIKGAFRIVPDYSNADDQDNKTGQLISGSGASQSAAMAMADIGLLTRFNFLKAYRSRDRNLALALTARNLGPPVMGDPLPSAASAGISYKPLRPLLLAFDFSVPLNLDDISLSEKPYWSVGTAVQITRFLSMRAGFLSKAGNVRIALGSAVDMDRISLDVNYTLDLLTQFTPLNRVSLGLRLNLGDQGRKALTDNVDKLYLLGLDAYAEGNADEAQSYWEEALKLNPRFDPAKEGLVLIEQTRELENRIDDMQRLNF